MSLLAEVDLPIVTADVWSSQTAVSNLLKHKQYSTVHYV